MPATRTLAALALAALVGLGACSDGDDDDSLVTGPSSPPPGGNSFDAECENDARPPVLTSLTAHPSELWPPNHQMVSVGIEARAEDPCDPLDISILSVRSNQPEDGLGDGDTAPDWKITGPLTVLLRAERSANEKDRREYTVRVRFADGVGNESFENIRVWVPHDQGGR